MATGRQMKLVGQTGEYLVAAELCRRGLIATTFTGNVPDYDIIASTEKGKHISVQVKSIRGQSWQFNKVTRFFDIEFEGHVQRVAETHLSPVVNLIFVFVKLGDYGGDRFFLCTWEELCNILSENYAEYLSKHNGVRPRKWDSLHTQVRVTDISHFENRWDLIEDLLERQD
jgi:hypothetical protein